VTSGRKIVELRPDVDWHKGKAVGWIVDAIVPGQRSAVAICAGDDVTDEDALGDDITRGARVRAGHRRSERRGGRPAHPRPRRRRRHRTSHAAIVSRELGVAAIVGAGDATTTLSEGDEVTVSCAEELAELLARFADHLRQ
jgi:hypothetical protein